MPQALPKQQSGLTDLQMLQQHIMLKQLQELRRHQQLQELGDEKKQNHFNQPFVTNKQVAGGQYLPLINGTPIHGASQVLMAGNMTLAHRGASPAGQGFPNGLYSRSQSQDLHSIGVAPQRLEASLYRTPITSSRNTSNQFFHSQGLSRYSADVLTKCNDNQTEKPTIQPTNFVNSFLGENCNLSSDEVHISDGAFLSKHFIHGRNITENFQQVNVLQRNAEAPEFNGMQEQSGRPGKIPGNTTQFDPSQGLTALDPLEQRILFNLDDKSDSFGRKEDTGTRGFGISLEYTEPSIQSGSWSALMQSAVVEASSSDTGLQEEWSGLSFQNTETSTDNQPSNFLESGNQPNGWVDKSQFLLNDSNTSCDFPGFEQSGFQFSIKQGEGMRSVSSNETVQQSPKMAPNWLGCSSQLNQTIEKSHTIPPLKNTLPWRSLAHSDGNARCQNVPLYNESRRHDSKVIGRMIESPSPSGNTAMNGCDDGNRVNMNGDVYTARGPEAYGNLPSYHQRENSNESHPFNAFQRIITDDEMRENMWQASGQVLWKDIFHGSRSHQQEYAAHFNFVGDASNSAEDMEKVSLLDIQRNSKALEDVPARENIRPNVSTSTDRSAGIYDSNVTSETRQNILQLLPTVDYTREQRTVSHFSSSDSSQILEVPGPETPETSMAKSHEQSSRSQHFGLRLAPPSQQSPTSNPFFSLQSPSQSGNSAVISPSSLCLKNQIHMPPVAIESPKATFPGMANRLLQFNRDTSQGISQPVPINFDLQFPFSEAVTGSHPSLTSSLPLGSSATPGLWTTLPSQPGPFGTECTKLAPEVPTSADSTNTNLQTCPWATKEQHDQNSYRGSVSRESVHPEKKKSQKNIRSDTADQVSHTGGLFQQKNYDSVWHADKQTLAVSPTDLEAFGPSLKPSNLCQNYSLLHQASSLNNVKTDSCEMVSGKNHGAGSDLNLQQLPDVSGHHIMYEHNSDVKDPLNSRVNVAAQQDSFPNRDVRMMSFDESTRASWEMAKTGRSYSHVDSTCDNVEPLRTEHSQISFQVTPSWFKHYGTLKNSQIVPMYDARTVKNSAQQRPFGNPFENLHTNDSMVPLNAASGSKVSAATLAVRKPLPPSVFPSEAITWNWSSTSLKKRKIEMSELLPWHKEVTQSSKRLHSISEAEIEWAQAANCLIEKVDDVAKMVKEAQPLVRLKRRLVLTTQLMQQLLKPAPAAILSADATSNYHSMVYFAAKLALVDACNLTSYSTRDSCLSSKGCDMMSEKPKTSERFGKYYFSNVTEDFISRSKKLESDLLRLENKRSFADVRAEYQELEKLCILNRFAKFHFREKPDAAETSPSNGATTTVPKSLPQRYVVVFPMPNAVPEGGQCFSL